MTDFHPSRKTVEHEPTGLRFENRQQVAIGRQVFGRTQVVPVGLRLDVQPFDGDRLAVDPEQPLDHELRRLVAHEQTRLILAH